MRTILSASLLASSMLTGLAGLSCFSPAASQEPSPPVDPLAGTIRSIVVEGNQRIESRTIQSYLLLGPGDPFDPQRLDISLKTLFATGLFADVDIGRRGSDLIVRVVENPIINRVLFEGNRSIDDDNIREEIQAEPRGIFTAARVQADVQRILELYRQSGRFAAQVSPQYKPLDQNRVDLIFEITDGPTTGVRSINFIGNEKYSDSRLRGELVTKQSRLWRFFSSNDNYDPDRLEFDRELLRQFYQNRGYYDFRITSAVAELTPDQQDWYITFTIEEGDQYDFGEIKVETSLDKLDGDALLRAVPIQEGELYEGDLIETSIDNLTAAAGISGYAFVDVIPRIEPNPDTGKIDVTFAMDEGPRVYIERINIVGNTRTLDRVVRRRLQISEGDAFNRVLLDRSRNRVRALGYFSEVEIEELPGTEPDRTIVDLSVEEQPTGELSLAAGFSSVDAFLIDVSISERNLRGRGQTAIARVSASNRQQIVDLRYQEPQFLGRNLAAGVSLFATRTDFSDVSSFESESFGASVNFGFPVTRRSQLSLRYRISQDEITITDLPVVINPDGSDAFTNQLDIDGNPIPIDPDMPDGPFAQVRVPPIPDMLADGLQIVDQCSDARVVIDPICLSERSELTSSVGYTFQWDGRNDPIAPTRGFDFSLSQDIAGLGGDVQFLRTEITGAAYRGLLPGIRASLRLSAGAIFDFSDDETLRINNRFFRGGNNFRGFNVAGIGPRVANFEIDENGVPTGRVFRGAALGGQAYYQGTLEVTLPDVIPQQYGIRGALFVDAGALGVLEDEVISDPVIQLGVPNPAFAAGEPGEMPTTNVITRIEDDLNLRAAAGLSVFWDSPFGPIRFDFAQVIADEAFDRPRGFRFSTTTRF
ncbi:MAG: outer membrane protein assembly factor BamA [Pseudomonadota bacterium]